MVDSEMAICDRAEPDLVITLAGANVVATRFLQQPLQFAKKPGPD
jgi:hypothetical protein